MSDHTAAATPGFLITKEYRRFAEFCDACRRYRYIGVCYGAPGVGKTLSARRYARWDVRAPSLTSPVSPPCPPAEMGASPTLLYTPPVANSPSQIYREVAYLQCALGWGGEDAGPAPDAGAAACPTDDDTELIVVDEADRLNMLGLEQLRDIYDRGQMGLVFIGMPGLDKRLARYPQLYSRVGFVHHFRALGAEEMRFILRHKWKQLGLTLLADDLTDAEAIAAVTRITGGNFRLLQRLFTQIERILQINHLRTVTKDVVDAAREGLVIGP